MSNTDDQLIHELNKKLEFAERNWKDASQANFLMEKRINDYEEKIKELEEYKKAYFNLKNSRSFRLIKKIARLVGVK